MVSQKNVHLQQDRSDKRFFFYDTFNLIAFQFDLYFLKIIIKNNLKIKILQVYTIRTFSLLVFID